MKTKALFVFSQHAKMHFLSFPCCPVNHSLLHDKLYSLEHKHWVSLCESVCVYGGEQRTAADQLISFSLEAVIYTPYGDRSHSFRSEPKHRLVDLLAIESSENLNVYYSGGE